MGIALRAACAVGRGELAGDPLFAVLLRWKAGKVPDCVGHSYSYYNNSEEVS